ncbi:MAG: tyrosine--tRNA ligase [Acidimicrobiia bacterium]
MDFLADLRARGLVHDSTDPAVLAARLAEGPISIYVGFDPTADSLHVGHLLGQFTLRRFQLAGHRPFALAGGATGMVGDPSGKSEERNLLDAETLRHNVERIEGQLQRILDFEPGPCGATLVNNFDWTAPVGILEFLRDVGKHVTVNQMMAKDSVRSRMEGTAGISYTEFSYMLLQANDFRHLCQHHGVEMQAGGSDQWGNITQGIDLIRRTLGRSAFGLTWPLLTKADGTKFGKSADGAVWLDPQRTSPYQFFQFWMGADDADVGRLLRQFTFLPGEETDAVIADHLAAPEKRNAQRRLAQEVTRLVHGPDQTDAVEAAARIVFGEDPRDATAAVLEALAAELPSTVVPELPVDLSRLLVDIGIAGSLSDARRGLQQRAFAVNGTKVTPEHAIAASDLLRGRFLMVSKGRKTHHIVEIADRS